ncbi:type II secretion system F family protein [Peptoniphilus equinus]|uniref:Type II secretion system F family protein n=1 Tax=Peptoniphilus equinus TaxID=3016343 RepID=A0ABY7QTG4_9FIRM|nr:type II secretion system F family protein [Peptoniphilus equinus]WBW49285.1 type II secretion system F family protein [Peptoniphilus equinus]
MIFNYSGFLEGKRVEGTLEASSLEDCEKMLLAQGYRIVAIDEQGGWDLSHVISRFRPGELAYIFYQLHILLAAGIPAVEALSMVSRTLRGKKAELFRKIDADLIAGCSLSAGFAATRAFEPIVATLLEVGEASENLSFVMAQLSTYYHDRESLTKQMASVLVYPVLLIFVTVFVINFVVLGVMPGFEELFTQAGVSLPWMTRVLLHISRFVSAYKWILLGVFIVVIAVGMFYVRSKAGRRTVERWLMHVKLYRDIKRSDVLTMLAFLVRSKVQLQDALYIVEEAVPQEQLKTDLRQARKALYGGTPLSESLRCSMYFDAMTIMLFEVAESSANFETILNALHDNTKRAIEMQTRIFLSVFEPVVIILLAIFVGFVIFAVAMPMFDIVNYVSWR